MKQTGENTPKTESLVTAVKVLEAKEENNTSNAFLTLGNLYRIIR